jgi:UDPglucose 6-dehydrogenase
VGFGGSCFQGHLEFGVFMPLLIFQKLLPREQVIILNDYQNTVLKNIISSLFNTVSDKKITFFGWAFKKTPMILERIGSDLCG